jgi:hypothetical protein
MEIHDTGLITAIAIFVANAISAVRLGETIEKA